MYYVIIITLLVCIKCGNLTIKLTSILLPNNIQDQVCKSQIKQAQNRKGFNIISLLRDF